MESKKEKGTAVTAFRAGITQFDITPPPGVRLAGYPHFPRENVGVHDRLFGNVFYLTNGEKEFVFVTVEVLFFSKKYATSVRRRICEAVGIPERQILICCSHSHSSPWMAGNPEKDANPGGKPDVDPDYAASLLAGIAASVVAAKASAFEAEIGFGVGHCGAESGIGGNRRDKNGISDPSVNVIAVRDTAGTVRGILVNYTLHPTFLHEDNLLVSGDYPSYLRRELEERYPDARIGFAQGTSGDQSSRYFRQGQSFDEAERVGRRIACEAARVIETMTFENKVEMDSAYQEIPIEIRDYPSIEELEEKVRVRTEYYQKLIAEDAGYLPIQNANLSLLGAEDMLGYALRVKNGERIDLRDDECPAEISVFRIGDHLIAGYPGEVFVTYGLKLKQMALAETTFIFELSNGCLPGYCITDDAYEEDAYEAGNCMLVQGYGEKIVATAAELARAVMAK